MALQTPEALEAQVIEISRDASAFMTGAGLAIDRALEHSAASEAAYLAAQEAAQILQDDLKPIKDRESFAYVLTSPTHPVNALSSEARTNIARVKSLSVALALTGTVGTAAYEEGGAWTSRVTPKAAYAGTQSFQGGDVPLLFHQEMLPKPGLTTRESLTRFVVLTMVSDTDPATPTMASPIRPALERLSGKDLDMLRQPLYRLRPYDAMAITGDGIVEEDYEPVLHEDGQIVADFADVLTEDPEALAAFERFSKASIAVSTAVTLAPGKTLVVDNRASFHGRGAIPSGHGKRLLVRAHAI